MKKKLMFLLCSGGMVLSLSTSIWTLANPTPAKALCQKPVAAPAAGTVQGQGAKLAVRRHVQRAMEIGVVLK
jgi:hypothetical protein